MSTNETIQLKILEEIQDIKQKLVEVQIESTKLKERLDGHILWIESIYGIIKYPVYYITSFFRMSPDNQLLLDSKEICPDKTIENKCMKE